MSVTDRGRQLAERLPYESLHGSAAETIRRLWPEVEGLVLMLATGAAVRIVAPLLTSKDRDPAVVCVDEVGRHAVALCGGHGAGANALAREVAALLGAEPVITTATDAVGCPALDLLPGYVASGDVAGVSGALLAGRPPTVEVRVPGWPPPAELAQGTGPERVIVADTVLAGEPGTVVLHPPSLVAGIGCSTDATPDEVRTLLTDTLRESALAPASVATVATIDRRADHPALTGLGLPVVSFPAAELDGVAVPNPSPAVRAAVGTSAVAEAAAILGAGPGSALVAPKRKSATATVAIARRRRPVGRLSIVGLGPGDIAHRTPAAAAAVRGAEVVIGYRAYLDQATDLLTASQRVESSPIGDEVQRARRALEEAATGRRVALVCSGDAGVYAMASLVVELASPEVEIEVVPGITAGLAAASLLGAPLGHDHAVVSLSDLLTPWEVIERRVTAAAEADLVVVFYNPRSAGRHWQLGAAIDILRRHRPPTTPVGVVTDAYRPGQQVTRTTLDAFDPSLVGMTSCVVVGSSTTTTVAGRMVTPRGYRRCP